MKPGDQVTNKQALSLTGPPSDPPVIPPQANATNATNATAGGAAPAGSPPAEAPPAGGKGPTAPGGQPAAPGNIPPAPAGQPAASPSATPGSQPNAPGKAQAPPSQPGKACDPNNPNSPLDAQGRPKQYTNTYGPNINSTNVLGMLGDFNLTIGAPPFKLQSCDQVMLIDGEELADLDDYTIRRKAFFTLNAYYVNMYSDRKPETLVESISIDSITESPQIIQGTKSCMIFRDGKNPPRNLTMCLNTECDAKDIVSSFKELKNCRLGKNLRFDFKLLFANCFLKNKDGNLSPEVLKKLGIDMSEADMKNVNL